MNNKSKEKAITKVLDLYRDGNIADSKKEALELLEKNIHNTAVYNILGLIYTQEYNFSEAKAMYEEAIKIDKQSHQLYLNLANVYLEEQSYAKAEVLYLKAISLGSNGYLVYFNLAKLYMAEDKYNKSKKMFEKAIELNPTHADILFENSLLFLKNKEYIKGFDLYRYRYDETKTDKQTYLLSKDKLLTKDTDIVNKKILLTYEQGFGDIIQFIRYVPMFEQLNAKVYVQVKQILYDLLQVSYPNIIFLYGGEMIDFDYHMPIMESAYYFSTTYESIPYTNGYLHVDNNKSNIINDVIFKKESKKRIGIVWRSNIVDNESLSKQKERINRNFTLEEFLIYFNSTDVQLYSLQVNITDKERLLLENNNIASLGDNLVTFNDNALIIDNLDLVIGIDTVSLIIAGAMGKEAIVILSSNSDWRWTKEDARTNWFKSIKIFRKNKNIKSIEIFEKISHLEKLFTNVNYIKKMLNIAIVYHQASYLEDAERLYRKILEVDSKNIEAYHYLGLIAFNSGHIQHAIALIQEAIKLNPEYTEAYENLKIILDSLQEKEIDIKLHTDNDFEEHLSRLNSLLKDALSLNDFSISDKEYKLIADMFYDIFKRQDIERKYQVQYIGCYYNFYMLDRNIYFKSSLPNVSKIFRHYIDIGLTVEALIILYDYITFMYWGLSSEISYLKTCDDLIIKPFSKYLLKYFSTNKLQKREKISQNVRKRVCYLGNITSYEGAYAVGRVMYSIFKGHYELNGGDFDFYYYAYGKVDEIFLQEIKDFGFKVRRFDQIDRLPQKLSNMREAFFKDEIDIAISEMPWGIPTYLFESRVAKIQIYLSLGWHYWSINNLEQLIVPSDATTNLQEYSSVGKNLPIGLDKSFIYKDITQEDIESKRNLYPKDKIIIGSIQRLVKIGLDYLEVIRVILQTNEGTIAILAGPGDTNLIDTFVEEHGLQDKIFIPGLVSSYIYTELFDIYIDTFYFPGGHSCLEAMGKNKPVVALYSEQWSGLKNSRVDILLAYTKDEYVKIVNKLLSNKNFYEESKLKTRLLIDSYTDLSSNAKKIEENFQELV